MAKYCVFVIDFGVQWILPTGVYFGVHRRQQPQWGAVYLSKLSEQRHFYKPQKSQFLVLSVWVVAVFHMVSIAESVFCLSSVPCLTQHSARRSKAELNWIGEGQQSLPYRNHSLWEMSGFWCLWKVWPRWVVLWKPTLILGGSNREWLAVRVRTASFCLDLVGAVGSSFLEGQVWRLISTDNRQGLESSRRPISGCDLWGHFQRDLTGMGRSTKKVRSTVTGAGVLDWIKWRNCPSTCIHLSGSDCIHCDHQPHALTAMMDSTLKWWENVNPWLP